MGRFSVKTTKKRKKDSANIVTARSFAIEQARAWMTTASQAGGVSAPVSKTFMNPGARRGERIDIEVIKGQAFVP